MKIEFTVLMPVNDRDDIDQLFPDVIASVYSNSLLPNHFILVVDGPIRQSLKNEIEKAKILYGVEVIWLSKNVGIAKALNHGLAKVKTEWVFRADADDFNLPNRFQEQVGLIVKGFDLIGSAIQEVDMNGDNIAIRRTPCTDAEIKIFMKYRNPFSHMTVAFRTDLARMCGGYPDIHLKEDYGLWASMVKCGARLANTSTVLVNATAGRDMYKRRGGWRYAKSEIELQGHLVKCGIKNRFSAVLHALLRASVYFLPSCIRGFIYESILRK